MLLAHVALHQKKEAVEEKEEAGGMDVILTLTLDVCWSGMGHGSWLWLSLPLAAPLLP